MRQASRLVLRAFAPTVHHLYRGKANYLFANKVATYCGQALRLYSEWFLLALVPRSRDEAQAPYRNPSNRLRSYKKDLWESSCSSTTIRPKPTAPVAATMYVLLSISLFELLDSCYRVFGLEDGTACNQNVSTRFPQQGSIFRIDAPIHFNQCAESAFIY